jgi:hypothetical protein
MFSQLFRLQCPFITFPPAQHKKHFHDNQVSQAVRLLFDSIKHRAGFIDPFRLAENIEPDVRYVSRKRFDEAFDLNYFECKKYKH